MRGVTCDVLSLFYPRFISTHTPHAGRDVYAMAAADLLGAFLLTRPMRGVTLCERSA